MLFYWLQFEWVWCGRPMQPEIPTSRLPLRPFCLDDATSVQKLAGEREVADASTKIPHPYEDGMAEKWIATHEAAFANESLASFAVVLRDSGNLIGACALTLDRTANKGELGYWIGKPYWNMGYATEASWAVVQFGFGTLGLNRVHARHLARNPTSGRIMQKLGMHKEGAAREDSMMSGQYEEVVTYGIGRQEWLELQGSAKVY